MQTLLSVDLGSMDDVEDAMTRVLAASVDVTEMRAALHRMATRLAIAESNSRRRRAA